MTYNISSLYQSPIRQYINQSIYQKPTVYISINNQKYQCIIHNKKISPISIYWAQILWISSSNLKSDYISDITNQITSQTKWICIYIQFGLSDSLETEEDTKNIIDNNSNYDSNNNIENKNILTSGSLVKSLRENMPSWSTYIHTSQDIDNIYNLINKSHKTHIKKAISRWLEFEVWKLEDKNKFYEIWKQTACDKWFGIPSQAKFDNLISYIYTENCGNIFLCKLNWKIIWWAICLFVELDGENVIIYLYGMTDRHAGNIGTNQFLHRNIIKRCHQNRYDIYDFLGISGIHDGDTHHLAGVTKFKLWYGGEAKYIYWSYDLVINKYIYRLYQKIAK